MAQYERAKLIKHPVITSLVHCRWKNVGRFALFVTFAIYSVFLTLLTLYTLSTAPVNSLFYINDNYQAFWMPNECAGPESKWILSADITALENSNVCDVIQHRLANASFNCNMSSFGPSYNEKWVQLSQAALFIFSLAMLFGYGLIFWVLRTFTNFIALCVFFITLILTAPFLPWTTFDCFYTYGLQHSWTWQLSSINILLGFIHLALMLEYAPRIGLYVLMLERVSITMLRALLAPFGFVVCSLAFCLHIVFRASVRHQQRHRDFGKGEFNDTDNDWPLNPFYTIPQAFSKTLLMFVGEYDMEQHFTESNLSVAWWVLMLLILFGTIVTMNLLTGLAVGEISDLQDQAEYQQLKMQIKYVLAVERIIRTSPLNKFKTFGALIDGSCFKAVLTEDDKMHKKLTPTFSVDIYNSNSSRTSNKIGLLFAWIYNSLFAAGNRLLSTSNYLAQLWELEVAGTERTRQSLAEDGGEKVPAVIDKDEQAAVLETLKAAMVKQSQEMFEIKAMLADMVNYDAARSASNRRRRPRSLI